MPPSAFAQSNWQVAWLSQVRSQSTPSVQVSVQLLLSVHLALHGPFVQVNVHVSLPLHVQLAPHSRDVPGGAPVSVAAVLSRTPLSVVGVAGVPELPGSPGVDGTSEVLPVPMFQS